MGSEELKTQCMCGTHVHKGTQIIGWITVVLSILSVNPIGVIIGGVMIYRLSKQKPEYYLPYLILQAIGIGITVIAVVALPFVLSVGIDKDRNSELLAVIVTEIFLILFLILAIYPCYVVPYRSHKLLNQEIGR